MTGKNEETSKLTLILAESASETIPKILWSHSAIQRYSKKRGKHPQFILLDRSYHHSAMKRLEESEKRGRPDIAHFALLEALSSPLNKEGLLKVYVHNINDHVISVNPEVRLPRNYNRFVGLLEQLFELERIPSNGKSLLKLERKDLPQLLREIRSDCVVAFSRKGGPHGVEDAVLRLSKRERPVAIVGGFPHGHFSEKNIKLADEVVCIDPDMLDASVVISRIIYEYEKNISLSSKRLGRLDHKSSKS